MEAADKDLEDRLREVGSRLSSPPLASVDELLSLLDQTEGLLSKVEQSPSVSMSNSLRPAMKALVAKEFLRHSDRDVKVAVAACLSEITRITAPEAPYDDEVMKEVFQRIVEAFENLDDLTSRSSVKRFTILETVAKVRSCVVMLDLECDDLILEMFRCFLRTIRSSHAANVFSSMETIMTLVLEESEDISQDLISCLFGSVKINNGLSPDAQRLGESVIKSCAEKLKPYLKEPPHSISEYNEFAASLWKGSTAAITQNANHASGEIMVEDRKLSERTSPDEFPQGSAKTELDVGYPDEHTKAAEKSSKPTTNNDIDCTGNGDPDVKESTLDEKPNVSCPIDQPKMSTDADKDLDSVDINSVIVQDKLMASNNNIVSSDTTCTLDAHLEKEADTSAKAEEHSSEAGTESNKVSSPVHLGGDDASESKQGRLAKSAKRSDGDVVGTNLSIPSGSEVPIDVSGVNIADVPSKDSDSKKESNSFGDSERRILNDSTKKSTDQTPRNAKGKSQRKKTKRDASAIVMNHATASGRNEPTDASMVKSENLLPKDSDSKKETESFSDSERRPLKDTGKRSHLVDNDQSPEKAEVKSRRQKVKSSSASKISQGESSERQQKLKVKQQDSKPKRKTDVPEQVAAKEMVSTLKPVKKSQVQDLEESPNALSLRKRPRGGADEVIETPVKSKIDGSIVGSKIKVWWPVDKQYYEGVIDSYDSSTKRHKILYADGDVEVLLLKKERWEFVNNVHGSQLAEDTGTQDGSLNEPRGKKAKTSSSSRPKDTDTDVSQKSYGEGSGSFTKRKGRPPKASPLKIDELEDADSPPVTNERKNKAASKSGHGSTKPVSKPNEKSNSKTTSNLLDDVQSSGKSRDETNKAPSKNKDDIGSTGKKGRKVDVPKEKFEETPKAGQQSRNAVTPKSVREPKANETSVKGKSGIKETESSARVSSGKGKVPEKEASSVRKRKRKGQR